MLCVIVGAVALGAGSATGDGDPRTQSAFSAVTRRREAPERGETFVAAAVR